MKISHRKPKPWTKRSEVEIPGRLALAIDSILFHLTLNPSPAALRESGSVHEEIHQILEAGTGVLFLHSQVLAKLDYETFALAYDRFCRWIGMPVPIDREGTVMKRVMDLGKKDSKEAPARGHMTNQELSFHSDRADLTALACWNPSDEGGEFKVCSSAWLTDQLSKNAPEIKSELTREIPHDLRDEAPSTAKDSRFANLPILYESDDTFVFRYIRKFNESVSRFGMAQTAETTFLLDQIDKLVQQPEHHLVLRFERGTIAIVNNHTTLHSRNAFADGENVKRCLLRYWLSSPQTRRLPDSFLPIFHRCEAGVPRGGVR